MITEDYVITMLMKACTDIDHVLNNQRSVINIEVYDQDYKSRLLTTNDMLKAMNNQQVRVVKKYISEINDINFEQKK